MGNWKFYLSVRYLNEKAPPAERWKLEFISVSLRVKGNQSSVDNKTENAYQYFD